MAQQSGPPRAAYVSRLFGRIAARYDLLNTVMSAGRHHSWRSLALKMAQRDMGQVELALDIAAGTCDFALSRHAPECLWICTDFSRPMLNIGKDKLETKGKDQALALADAHMLPFREGSFSLATVGFGMRNFTDRGTALREIRRVLKKGGRVAILDIFSSADSGLSGRLFGTCFALVAPILGMALAGDRDAYAYLPKSAATFRAEDLQRDMEAAGLTMVGKSEHAFGTVQILIGQAD